MDDADLCCVVARNPLHISGRMTVTLRTIVTLMLAVPQHAKLKNVQRLFECFDDGRYVWAHVIHVGFGGLRNQQFIMTAEEFVMLLQFVLLAAGRNPDPYKR